MLHHFTNYVEEIVYSSKCSQNKYPQYFLSHKKAEIIQHELIRDTHSYYILSDIRDLILST